MSYNQRTHGSVGAFQVSFHVVRLGIPLALFSGGPRTDHPCSLPASPDTSDAGDVIQRCPPQLCKTSREHSTIISSRPMLKWFLGVEVYRLLSSIIELPLSDLFSVVQLAWTTLLFQATGSRRRHQALRGCY